ncbi:hypothetical protein K505DRAFT_340303 [Melanomma pulvis-pyrius CBS 109.77]|uniref:Uncharacterized protein n=1 Tax=Melanomma pulvis-pyrius CBS 109.77 TaxID=1314802 RepID=A0A6A6X370_9PLEO|nr:hypothetical protein K505DRAFT_340303 [Melanomma pulvis-pyrius CBS 109.77]
MLRSFEFIADLERCHTFDRYFEQRSSQDNAPELPTSTPTTTREIREEDQILRGRLEYLVTPLDAAYNSSGLDALDFILEVWSEEMMHQHFETDDDGEYVSEEEEPTGEDKSVDEGAGSQGSSDFAMHWNDGQTVVITPWSAMPTRDIEIRCVEVPNNTLR